MMEQRFNLAAQLVEQAGQVARRAHASRTLAVSSKGVGDVVSEADYAIETMIRTAVAEKFPGDSVVGEEFGGEAGAGFTWLIDPIDGTVNFVRRLGYFCVSLALLQGGRPVAAFILDPLQGELFSAGPDRVMRVNGEAVRCADQTDIREAVVALGFSSRHEPSVHAAVVGGVVAAGAEHRRLGAGALCLAHVAAGRLDAYFEPHMNPWDAVGGLYLCACAGAVTSDYIGLGGLRDGATVFASGPSLSGTLLAALPAPYSGTPLHRENEPRSAGELRDFRKPFPNVET